MTDEDKSKRFDEAIDFLLNGSHVSGDLRVAVWEYREGTMSRAEMVERLK